MSNRLLRHNVRLVRFQTRFQTRALIAASCLGVASLASVSHAEDLTASLDAVPAGAEFVMIIPSMQAASDAVADLAEMFNADEPEMLDLLGSFKSEMGITAGLDDDGAAIVVIAGLFDAIANDTKPEPIVLLPVSDYAAFVQSIGGTDGGVTAVMLEGESGFAKKLGNFAVLGENQAAVEAYAAGDAGAALLERVGKYGAEGANDALMAGFIDIAAMRPALIQKIDEAMAQAADEMRNNMGEAEGSPIAPESVAALMESCGDLGRLLLEGVDAAMFTATSDDAGIRGGYAWNVVEGSKLATYLTGQRAEFAGLLNQMPSSPYIFATAIDTTAIDLGGMSTDLLDAVGEAMGDEPMFAGIMEMVKESMVIYEQMNAGAQVFYAPDMAALMGGGFMKTLAIYDVDDTDAAIAAWRTSMAKMPGMIPAMMEQAGVADQAPAMDFTFEWTENALNLGGTDVHQYDLKMILPPEVRAEMGPAAMMMGNAGTSGYVAAVDGKLVLTTVPDAQLMTQGLNALKDGNGLGTAAVIEAARADLPSGLVMEAFVSLDGIATAANPFLMMFANGLQIDVPADLAPVSMGIGMDGTAMGAKAVLPMSVLTFVRDTVQSMEAMGQQQGGGGRRAPY